MEITTNIYLTVVALLTTNLLIKCEGDHDNDISRELQPIEPFSDHLDYLDHLDHLDHFDELNVQSNNHGPVEKFQINALQPSDLSDPILNNNFNKVIQRVQVIHHDGDLVTKYETTSHTNHEESDELYDDSLISSLQSSAPNAYTKIVKKTVFKQNHNGRKNSQESSQPVEIIYSNNKSKEIEIDNSMSKTQSMSQIDHMKNIGMPLSSQQFTDLPDILKSTVQTKVTKISPSGSKLNELDGSTKRKYNANSMPSSNIISATSSSRPNYSGTTGSLQSYPIEKDDRTKIIYKTEIIGNNGSTGRPLKRISRKPGNSFKSKKTITKYQDYDNDYSDPDEYNIDHNTGIIRSPTTGIVKNNSFNGNRRQRPYFKPGNSFEGEKTMITKYQDINDDYSDLDEEDIYRNTERIRSSNNILSTTSSLNSNYYDGATDSLQSNPMGENGKIKKISTTEIIGKNGKPIQRISSKPESSFKDKKTIITKYQGYENDYSDLDDYDIDRNTERLRSSTTGITKINSSNGTRRQRTSLKPVNSFKDEKTITKYQNITNNDDDDSNLDEQNINLMSERIRSSNNILSTTSSLNSNYYDGATGSLQSYPTVKDNEINTISTTEIIDKNSSNGKLIQRISRKPGNSFKGNKMIITKYHGDNNDFSGSDEYSINFNKENTRSSNNIVSKLNPAEYNKIITTSTTDRDNTSNDQLESNTKPQINYDLTYSSPQLNQKVSNNFGSSGQTQTNMIKQQGSIDESNYNDANDNVIEYNMIDEIASQNNNINSNYMISSFDNNNGNYMSYNIIPSGAPMSGMYKSSMKTNENSNNGNGLLKKMKKIRSKNKDQGGSSKQMRSKNKLYTIRNRNRKMGGSKRSMAKNSRSSGRQSGSQSNRSNVEMKSGDLGKSSSFSQSYSYGLPMQHGIHRSCNCNNRRKLIKRQSSEINENNYSKDIYGLKNLRIENMIRFPPPFGASVKNAYAPPLLPPLPLLQQIHPPPPPLPPSPSFASQSGQKLTNSLSDQSANLNDVFNQHLTDQLVDTTPYQITDIKQDFRLSSGPQRLPGHPRPPGPPRQPGLSGLQMNPFDSFGPPRGEHLLPPSYPYSSFEHFSSNVPVVMNLGQTSFPLPSGLMDMLPGQEKQVTVDAELIQTQQNNDVSNSKIEGIDTTNSESVTASTQSNVINNINNDPIIEYNTETIKTIENMGDNGIPEANIVESQVEIHDFTETIA